MGRQKLVKTSEKKSASHPARSPEARESQLVALAYDLVEERLRNGTATSSETVAILRLGTQKERLERELNEKKIALMEAKTEALQSAKRIEELYGAAIDAMRRYSGASASMEYEDDDDDIY